MATEESTETATVDTTAEELLYPPSDPLRDAASILIAAAGFVRQGWIKSMLAANENKHPVPFDSPKACYWCAVGAIKRAGLSYGDGPTAVAIRNLARVVGHRWVSDWNNMATRTQEQVADMMELVASTIAPDVG